MNMNIFKRKIKAKTNVCLKKDFLCRYDKLFDCSPKSRDYIEELKKIDSDNTVDLSTKLNLEIDLSLLFAIYNPSDFDDYDFFCISDYDTAQKKTVREFTCRLQKLVQKYRVL